MIIINDNEVKQECSICNHITHIKLTDEELEAYRGYLMGGGLIQECLKAKREAARTASQQMKKRPQRGLNFILVHHSERSSNHNYRRYS